VVCTSHKGPHVGYSREMGGIQTADRSTTDNANSFHASSRLKLEDCPIQHPHG